MKRVLMSRLGSFHSLLICLLHGRLGVSCPMQQSSIAGSVYLKVMRIIDLITIYGNIAQESRYEEMHEHGRMKPPLMVVTNKPRGPVCGVAPYISSLTGTLSDTQLSDLCITGSKVYLKTSSECYGV
jgi:hypothetical protein